LKIFKNILTDNYFQISNEIEKFENLIKECQRKYDENLELFEIDIKQKKLENLKNELKQILIEINISTGGNKIIKKFVIFVNIKLISGTQ
jgi:hypothetical protein